MELLTGSLRFTQSLSGSHEPMGVRKIKFDNYKQKKKNPAFHLLNYLVRARLYFREGYYIFNDGINESIMQKLSFLNSKGCREENMFQTGGVL